MIERNTIEITEETLGLMLDVMGSTIASMNRISADMDKTTILQCAAATGGKIEILGAMLQSLIPKQPTTIAEEVSE